MARTDFSLLLFQGHAPSWRRFDGDALLEIDAPASGQPALALLPDRFFFYYQPQNAPGGTGRRAVKALLFQMQNYFPGLAEGGLAGTTRPVQGRMLGFYAKPELQGFLAEHAGELSRVSGLTTPLVLCWAASLHANLDCWTWRGEDDLCAISCDGALTYFKGDAEEESSRLQATPASAMAEAMDLERALDILRRDKVRLSSFKLPLAFSSRGDENIRPYLRAAAIVAALGLTFLLGQGFRLHAEKQRVESWKNRITEVYKTALGPQPGPDPYGKLLFEIDKLGSGAGGFDVLGLLAVLSESAPEGLNVENVNVTGDSGTIQASVKSYDKLDKLMEGLKTRPEFQFNLEQATNTDKGVSFTIKVGKG